MGDFQLGRKFNIGIKPFGLSSHDYLLKGEIVSHLKRECKYSFGTVPVRPRARPRILAIGLKLG
jgi:hypothetical protein